MRWTQETAQGLLDASVNTGGKMFATLMDIARGLRESDRLKLAKGKGTFSKIVLWFNRHPTVRMALFVVGIVMTIFLVMIAAGVIKAGR